MAEIHDFPTHATCPVCMKVYPAFLLARHVERCHPLSADDALSTYDAMHPNSASAKFAELVREAATRGGER